MHSFRKRPNWLIEFWLIVDSLHEWTGLTSQGRSVHIRTYVRAYSWNLQNILYFIFPENIFVIKSGRERIKLSWSGWIDKSFNLPVWRVDVSPFACNLLKGRRHCFLPLFRKHCTLPITLEMSIKQLIIAFSFVFIIWKWHFWAPEFEKFSGVASPQTPPPPVCREDQPFFPCAHLQTSRYAPESSD